jgi:hypothetical protein
MYSLSSFPYHPLNNSFLSDQGLVYTYARHAAVSFHKKQHWKKVNRHMDRRSCRPQKGLSSYQEWTRLEKVVFLDCYVNYQILLLILIR